MNDAMTLINDIEVFIRNTHPNIDTESISKSVEQVVGNYTIQRRNVFDVKNDLDEKIMMFISAKKVEGLSDKTLEGYATELGLFSNYVNKPVPHIKTSDIRSFLGNNPNHALSTLDKKLSVLKSFFGWLVIEELLLRDPTLKVNPPKVPERLPKALSIKELEIVRDSCKTLRERALLETLYSTGARLSEIANMKVDHLNIQSMSIRVVGKGDKERITYLSVRALHHLQKYLQSRNDNCEYLFVTQRRPIRQMSNATIQREMNIIGKRSRLSSSLTPHRMRHSLATNMINNGADLADVQQILGHENPQTTMIYARVSEERRQTAFRRFHVQ